jgi:hypothetical protein
MAKRGPKPGSLRRILTGQVFGRLRVVGYNGRRITGRKDEKDTDSFWRCYCDPVLGGCGNYSIHSRGNLLRKKPPGARSDGCLRRDLTRARWKIYKLVMKAAATAIDSAPPSDPHGPPPEIRAARDPRSAAAR